jgi:hypothetical protein
MKKILTIGLFILSALPALAAAGLPFMDDRYDQALSQAKRRNLPLFVECWAPW